jgi:hypothetical protein
MAGLLEVHVSAHSIRQSSCVGWAPYTNVDLGHISSANCDVVSRTVDGYQRLDM